MSHLYIVYKYKQITTRNLPTYVETPLYRSQKSSFNINSVKDKLLLITDITNRYPVKSAVAKPRGILEHLQHRDMCAFWSLCVSVIKFFDLLPVRR